MPDLVLGRSFDQNTMQNSSNIKREINKNRIIVLNRVSDSVSAPERCYTRKMVDVFKEK
jgi:hypothetical protein